LQLQSAQHVRPLSLHLHPLLHAPPHEQVILGCSVDDPGFEVVDADVEAFAATVRRLVDFEDVGFVAVEEGGFMGEEDVGFGVGEDVDFEGVEFVGFMAADDDGGFVVVDAELMGMNGFNVVVVVRIEGFNVVVI